jgi:hypothetical protein
MSYDLSDRVDRISVDSGEEGWFLIVDTVETGRMQLRLHFVDLYRLYRQAERDVNQTIADDPWWGRLLSHLGVA